MVPVETEKIVAFLRKIPSGGSRTAVYAGLAVFLLALIIFANTVNGAHQVLVNGQKVALVKDKRVVEQVVQELLREKRSQWGQPVTTPSKVTFRKTKAKKIELDGSHTLKKKLAASLDFYSQGVAIRVNGRNRLVVKNQAAAKEVLQKISQGETSPKAVVQSVKFLDKVELVEQVNTPLEKILPVDEAVEYIKTGGREVQTYTVKAGDSLWSIARAHDMRVKELQAANPELRNERIDIGQVLKLVKVQPIIDVETTLQISSTQRIPYSVEYQKDKSLKRGQEKIKQKGSDGSREVTYQVVLRNGIESDRKVIAENIIKKPINQIVLRGNKPVLLAYRGDDGGDGGGNLYWPARGGISSGYGYRWGRMHTGIDIDGNTGDPVRAAEDGRVVFTGWYYEYGKTIIINHGNGLVTRYGHLSAISVSEGDQVTRGQVIGKIGSTGRSTGSHLHFETLVNGSFKNPIKFLR